MCSNQHDEALIPRALQTELFFLSSVAVLHMEALLHEAQSVGSIQRQIFFLWQMEVSCSSSAFVLEYLTRTRINLLLYSQNKQCFFSFIIISSLYCQVSLEPDTNLTDRPHVDSSGLCALLLCPITKKNKKRGINRRKLFSGSVFQGAGATCSYSAQSRGSCWQIHTAPLQDWALVKD